MLNRSKALLSVVVVVCGQLKRDLKAVPKDTSLKMYLMMIKMMMSLLLVTLLGLTISWEVMGQSLRLPTP